MHELIEELHIDVGDTSFLTWARLQVSRHVDKDRRRIPDESLFFIQGWFFCEIVAEQQTLFDRQQERTRAA